MGENGYTTLSLETRRHHKISYGHRRTAWLLFLAAFSAATQATAASVPDPGPGVCANPCPTLSIPSEPSAPDLSRSFFLDRVEAKGDFFVQIRDGRRLSGQNAGRVPIDNGARVITGPNSAATVYLSDGTKILLDSNTEFVVDEIAYDPDTSIKKATIGIVKGVLRWVTGKFNKPTLKTAVARGAVRGTDFECAASPDGSGYVKLYSGEMEFTAYDTGSVITLRAGQMLTYTNFTNISGPMPIR